jgi:flagellar FliL protein
MADETTAPNAEGTQAPAKKKSRKMLMVIVLNVILLAGGGGGFYLWKARSASKALAATEAATKAAAKKDAAGDHEKTETANGEDADVTQVIELQPFIVNLADKNDSRYLRMSISLGVGGEGGPEAKVDPLYTTKIRNALLATISTRTSDQILTVEGKAALRKEMLSAARSAASKPEVLAIYITDFIIQM